MLRARVAPSYPIGTIEPSLPNLAANLVGNLFELAALSGLRIGEIRLPPPSLLPTPVRALGPGARKGSPAPRVGR